VLKLIGIIVAIAIGVAALWLLVDRAMYRFGGIGGLIFGFLLVYLLFYLADRRKIKESEDLIAERKGLG
jgi:membrane associated rhomboid family serine protease